MDNFDHKLFNQIKHQPKLQGKLNIWLGEKVRLLINTQGQINSTVRSTLRKALGAPMIVGYEKDETCGPATLTFLTDVRDGHVGGICV
jgi:hypothetical protein